MSYAAPQILLEMMADKTAVKLPGMNMPTALAIHGGITSTAKTVDKIALMQAMKTPVIKTKAAMEAVAVPTLRVMKARMAPMIAGMPVPSSVNNLITSAPAEKLKIDFVSSEKSEQPANNVADVYDCRTDVPANRMTVGKRNAISNALANRRSPHP